MRDSPSSGGAAVSKYVNLNLRSYLKFLSWMPAALHMPEDELIDHAGLDSVIFLRIYRTGYGLQQLYVLASLQLSIFVVYCSVANFWYSTDVLNMVCLQQLHVLASLQLLIFIIYCSAINHSFRTVRIPSVVSLDHVIILAMLLMSPIAFITMLMIKCLILRIFSANEPVDY